MYGTCHSLDPKGCIIMRPKIISTALLICLFVAPAAQAAYYPGHHPGPAPRPIFSPYRRPGYRHYPVYRSYRHSSNNDIWISLGAGLLIGSLISGMNRTAQYSPYASITDPAVQRNNYSYSQSFEGEREISLIRSRAAENAKTESRRASGIASEHGSEQAAYLLAKAWEGEGRKTVLDSSAGLQVLKVTGFYDGSLIKYTFLPESRKVYVRISVPDYLVSVEESSYYTGSTLRPETAQLRDEDSRMPLLRSYSNAPVVLPEKSVMLRHAGFGLEGSFRSPAGHLVIGEVGKGTAAYYAGIRPGDALISVDVYDTRNFDAVWFDNYISERHRSCSMIVLLILRKGTEKRIEIQL